MIEWSALSVAMLVMFFLMGFTALPWIFVVSVLRPSGRGRRRRIN